MPSPYATARQVCLIALASCFSLIGSSFAADKDDGGASKLDLGKYTLSASYALPAKTAAETSAITWNWDSDTLFIVGDEGKAIVQVDKQGAQIDYMRLKGFDDTEGLTYIGDGQFVITEERLQSAYLLRYAAGTSVKRSSLPSLSIAAPVGNDGIEGISYDRLSGGYIAVKEKSPQAVHRLAMNFSNQTIRVETPFVPKLGLIDLSDVQTLGSVAALSHNAKQNMLILSQKSAKLLELSPSGAIVSNMDIRAITKDAEGVTIDAKGTIYLTSQAPRLYVLVPK